MIKIIKIYLIFSGRFRNFVLNIKIYILMKVSAIKLKKWSEEVISPLAWQRTVLKALPALKELGYELNTLMNPDEKLFFTEVAFEALEKAIKELYQIEILPELVTI